MTREEAAEEQLVVIRMVGGLPEVLRKPPGVRLVVAGVAGDRTDGTDDLRSDPGEEIVPVTDGDRAALAAILRRTK